MEWQFDCSIYCFRGCYFCRSISTSLVNRSARDLCLRFQPRKSFISQKLKIKPPQKMDRRAPRRHRNQIQEDGKKIDQIKLKHSSLTRNFPFPKSIGFETSRFQVDSTSLTMFTRVNGMINSSEPATKSSRMVSNFQGSPDMGSLKSKM